MLEINQFNLHAGLPKDAIHFRNHWHKIVVENVEELDRDAVLRTLMKFCSPSHFIPVCYKCFENTASFLLKNSGEAIEKFCQQNLIVDNPYNKDKPFKITINLCFATTSDFQINVHNNVTEVLARRFNKENGLLNLEKFAKDTELQEYFALSQPKLFCYVLNLAKSIPFRSLKLSHNDIEFLKPMELLQASPHQIAIDLRNNNIKNISELLSMKHLNLIELWLDGNPLCDNYDETNYGEAIRKHLEKLEKVDGVNIQLHTILPFRRNFLCNVTGFDLVDQFLEHYFTLYDAQNRSVLKAVYHKDALFSLTSEYIGSQVTSNSAKLAPYKQVTRNLKQISDFNKNSRCLYSGPLEIVNVLNSLPISEHDPYSFTVDLVIYTETTAMLMVSGVFRESSDSLLESDRMLGFTRTFVLLAGQNGEYSIINEMVHIANATTSQATRAFKQMKLPKPRSIYLPQPQDTKEQHDMSVALEAITGLKLAWARKFLEECKYDMKEALALFIDFFKIDKLPRSAFIGAEDRDDDTEIQYKFETQAFSNQTTAVNVVKNSYLAQPMPNIQPSNQTRLSVMPVEKVQPYIFSMPQGSGMTSRLLNTVGPLREISSGPTWDKLADKKELPNKQHGVIEYIDLSSSPEKARLDLKNLNEDIFSTKQPKMQEETQENSLEPLSSAPSKRQLKKFQHDQYLKELQQFKLRLQDGTSRKDIYEIARGILRIFCDRYSSYEEMFELLYKANVSDARKLKHEMVLFAIAENETCRLIDPCEIEVLGAKFEYIYGNEVIAEREFIRMMSDRPDWLKPIVEYCKVLLTKKRHVQARKLVKPYSSNSNLLNKKMRKQIKLIENQYNVVLW